jgi:hypothetical protein
MTFGNWLVAAEAMPTFLGGLCELEDHGESCLSKDMPSIEPSIHNELAEYRDRGKRVACRQRNEFARVGC